MLMHKRYLVRHWSRIWLAILFVVASFFVSATPCIRLEKPNHDFGEVAPNVTVDWSCAVSNVGDRVLSVMSVRACCGASVGEFPSALQPGTGAVLRVSLNPGAQPGPFRKTVTVFSDDPKHPVSIVTLSGRIRDYVPVVGDGKVRLVSAGEGPPRSSSSIPLTVPVILVAGLVDGFNPCAFSIVIFLAGTLAVGGRRRRARLLGGWSFCLASFATYMLMGFGLLGAIRTLDGMGGVRDVIFAALSVSLFILAFLSFRDAVRYRRLRVPAAITLQLPDGVKRAIRSFAEASWSGPAVVGTGLVCGFVVTLLDSLCTGQVYVPVLAILSRESGWSHWALSLLALYNLAFIAPLVAIFVLAAYGAGSERMARWSKRNVVPSKIFLGLVFILLGVLLCPRLGEDFFAPFFQTNGKSVENPIEDRPERHRESARRQSHSSDSRTREGLSLKELAKRNAELDAALREPVLPPDFPTRLVAVVRDRTQDEQWRNYCVQVIPECWMRLEEDSPARDSLLSALRLAMGERETVLPGTALLGFGRLSERSDDFSDEFVNAVLSVASDPLTRPENRVTALRLAAERGIREIFPSARHWAKSGETPLLRASAAATVRDLTAER